MKEIRCDRCGEKMECRIPEKIEVKKILYRSGSYYTSATLDLCKKCEKEVFDFIFREKR